MDQMTNVHYQPSAFDRITRSKHASRQAQRRAIPIACHPLLKTYGQQSHDGKGGIRYLMTARSMAQLIKAVGYTKRLEALVGCYLVVAADNPDRVITVGHRHG